LKSKLGDGDGSSADFDRAIAIYTAAIAAKPDDAETLNGACWARAVANRELDIALGQCRRSLEIRPHTPATLDSLGFVQFRLHDFPGALASYDQALAVKPEAAGTLFMRGIVKLRLGQSAQGNADLAAAAILVPAIFDIFGSMGVAR
jgi:tetratricopeptide (TPR) repeat protein